MKKEEKFKDFIGIDVSKNKLDIYISANKENKTICNNEQEIKRFIREIQKESIKELLVVIDLTGGYEALAIKEFCKAGFDVYRAQGRKIRNFIRAYGENAKTDKIDAYMLTEYAKVFQNRIRLYKYNDEKQEQEKLIKLIKRLSEVDEYLKEEKNRLQAPDNEILQKYIKSSIKNLEKQKDKLEKVIQEELDKNEELSEKQKVLMKQIGIAKKTSMILLALLPELGKLNRRQIAALSGVAPYPQDSGSIHGKRSTKSGRKEIKRLLFICTLVSINFDKKIKEFYNRLISKGKIKMVAIVACMRKLITILNARCKAFYNNVDFIEY